MNNFSVCNVTKYVICICVKFNFSLSIKYLFFCHIIITRIFFFCVRNFSHFFNGGKTIEFNSHLIFMT